MTLQKNLADTIVGVLEEGNGCIGAGRQQQLMREFKFSTIEEEDVLKLLCSLDPNKAVGVDGISAKLLRTAAPGISHSVLLDWLS